MTTEAGISSDLPRGYRWATEEETLNWESLPHVIWVVLTKDHTGKPYTQGEADLAVPIGS